MHRIQEEGVWGKLRQIYNQNLSLHHGSVLLNVNPKSYPVFASLGRFNTGSASKQLWRRLSQLNQSQGVKHIQVLHSFQEKQGKKKKNETTKLHLSSSGETRSEQTGNTRFSDRVRVFRAEMSTAFCSAKHTVMLSTTGCSRAAFQIFIL